MMKKENPESKSVNVKFEDALRRLEKIVEKLETGDVPLEESLALYEEGITLFRHCSSKLEEAKKKVEILTKEGSGKKMKVEPFRAEKETVFKETDQEEIPF